MQRNSIAFNAGIRKENPFRICNSSVERKIRQTVGIPIENDSCVEMKERNVGNAAQTETGVGARLYAVTESVNTGMLEKLTRIVKPLSRK